MSTKKRTIALIGLGVAARTIHLPAYKKLDQLDVVGGHDPQVKAGSSDFTFPAYNSIPELLEQTRPDILAIASPTPYHFQQAIIGLEHGCHIFCEKPFTTSLDEARQLIALAEKQQRWIVVNNEFRFMNIYQAAKNKIDSDDFGELLFVSAQQMFHVNEATEAGWRGEDPQRTCKEFGIHVLDLCRYFFDEDPRQISAKMPRPGNPDGPDYLNLIQLDFSNDRTAYINLDRLSRGRHRYLDLRLDGSKATIETEFGGSIEFKAGVRGGDRKPYAKLDVSLGGRAFQFHGEQCKKIASDPLDIFANATSKLLANFLQALDCGDTPACCAQDNIKTLALMLAAYESADTDQTIAFAEHWT